MVGMVGAAIQKWPVAVLVLVLWIAAAASAQEVRRFRSQHFDVQTDATPELAKPLVWRIDHLYKDYTTWFGGDLRPIACDLLLVGTEEQYRRLLRAPEGPIPAALYNPRKQAILLCVADRPMGGMYQVLQHELAHCAVQQLGGDSVPVWLNEGLAEYFGEGLIADEQLVLGEISPQRAEDLRFASLAAQYKPVGEFVNYPHAQWHATARAGQELGVGRLYLQAWGLVHYLLQHSGEGEGPAARDAAPRMLKLIREGQSAERALEEVFALTYAQLDKRFRAWAAVQHEPTATAMQYDTAARLGSLMVGLQKQGIRVNSAREFYQRASDLGLRSVPGPQTIGIAVGKSVDQTFRRRDGKRFTEAELWLEDTADRPAPDIVFHCFEKSQLRVRFRKVGDRVVPDIVYEVPRSGATMPAGAAGQ